MVPLRSYHSVPPGSEGLSLVRGPFLTFVLYSHLSGPKTIPILLHSRVLPLMHMFFHEMFDPFLVLIIELFKSLVGVSGFEAWVLVFYNMLDILHAEPEVIEGLVVVSFLVTFIVWFGIFVPFLEHVRVPVFALEDQDALPDDRVLRGDLIHVDRSLIGVGNEIMVLQVDILLFHKLFSPFHKFVKGLFQPLLIDFRQHFI